jgi:plasmid stabilization system protein ParE
MYKVKISREAKKDLLNIAKFIALDNVNEARKFSSKLLEKIYSLSLFPKKGKKSNDCYYLIHKNYLVFYDIHEKKKEVDVVYIKNTYQYSSYKNFF